MAHSAKGSSSPFKWVIVIHLWKKILPILNTKYEPQT